MPSAIQRLTNYVQTTLASGVTSGATSISVVSAAGLPTSGNFMLRIDDPAPATTFEYVECTNVAGTTLTVTRGQEGTTGIAHSAGAIVGNDLTSAMLIRAFPLGWLGDAETSTDQGTFTALTDITALAVTVTVGTNRKIRVSAFVAASSSVANDSVGVQIREGGTSLQEAQFLVGLNTTVEVGQSISVPLTPTAGSHTYKVSMRRVVGTGNITFRAVSFVCYLLVEDIGSL
jgi:hypothetical protein